MNHRSAFAYRPLAVFVFVVGLTLFVYADGRFLLIVPGVALLIFGFNWYVDCAVSDHINRRLRDEMENRRSRP